MSAPGRYADCEELVHSRDGTTIVYRATRILPRGAAVTTGKTTEVGAGEVHRLDLLAYRVLKNPLLAYRIADANDAMDPLGLCSTAGVRVALPRSDL